jgi:RNA polymerase sigma-70 factor (ECF subfamily)
MTVQLYYWEGMPVAEIAEVTEVATSTVTSRLARARERMREAVEGMRLPRGVESSVVGNLEGWTRSLVTGQGR